MKKIILIALAAFAVSCQNGEENKDATFKASIANVEDGTEVYLAKLGDQGRPEPIDTVQVQGGSFELKLPEVDFQTLNIISFKNVGGNVIFINENEALTATLQKDSLRSAKIEGGKENQLFQDYIGQIQSSSKKMNDMVQNYQKENPNLMQNPDLIAKIRAEQQQIQDEDAKKREELVENNPNSLVSILVLSDMINSKTVSTARANTLFNGLSKEVQNSQIGGTVSKILKSASATAVGSKAPEFSAPTPSGEQLALKDALGKVTILDFWASWCKPCRVENPNVVKLYAKYHDKGLNILGISLDKSSQKDKWLKAIEDDGLTLWHNAYS